MDTRKKMCCLPPCFCVHDVNFWQVGTIIFANFPNFSCEFSRSANHLSDYPNHHMNAAHYNTVGHVQLSVGLINKGPVYQKHPWMWAVSLTQVPAPSDLVIHKGRNKESADTSSRRHLDIRALQPASIILSTQHSLKHRTLTNGSWPGSGFGTSPLVFHNLGHQMVFESVQGNSAGGGGAPTCKLTGRLPSCPSPSST